MSKDITLKTSGAPSLDELRAAGMLPSAEEYKKHGCVCIECVEEIPCNPCETSCPRHALTVGSPITNLPVLDRDKCVLCGLCVAACPGLAITIKSIKGDKAAISFPWEYLPLPAVGQEVEMVNRLGEAVCAGRVTAAVSPARNNRTAVVTAEFPGEYIDDVVSMRRNHE